VESAVEIVKCDVFPDGKEKFDYIFSNPPYIDTETHDILERSVWDKGNIVLRRIMKEADQYLKSGGKLFLSWANFADFVFFENEAVINKWRFKVIAKGGNDPKFNATIDTRMESRIYELWK